MGNTTKFGGRVLRQTQYVVPPENVSEEENSDEEGETALQRLVSQKRVERDNSSDEDDIPLQELRRRIRARALNNHTDNESTLENQNNYETLTLPDINNRDLPFEMEYDSDSSIDKDRQSTASDSEDEQNKLDVNAEISDSPEQLEIEQEMEIDEVKNVHENHILKTGFNNKVKPPIKQRFKPEVKLRKSQKHKVCNGDTSDKLAVNN